MKHRTVIHYPCGCVIDVVQSQDYKDNSFFIKVCNEHDKIAEYTELE